YVPIHRGIVCGMLALARVYLSFSRGSTISRTLMMKRHKKRTSAAKSRPRRSPSRGLRQTRGSERQTASSLDKPSVVVVMGVSGSGKSTIALMLAHRLNWLFEEGV